MTTPTQNTRAPRPLDGITVISLEHAIAAPFCTRQLADMGARVIKIERPGGGDFARHYDERVNGLSSHFVWTNRSKESLTLNLKEEGAIDVMARLLETADVLVQNLAPGAAARLGLDFDQLHERFPRLIVCDISGYGSDGPYHEKKAYDLLIQGEVGLVSITGTEDTPVGPVPALIPPCSLDGVEPRMDPIPSLGEHTDKVLAELGYDNEEIRQLREDSIL